jgi:hypothetical protein
MASASSKRASLEEGISPAVEAFVERAAEGAKSIGGRFHGVSIMHPPRDFRILCRRWG